MENTDEFSQKASATVSSGAVKEEAVVEATSADGPKSRAQKKSLENKNTFGGHTLQNKKTFTERSELT